MNEKRAEALEHLESAQEQLDEAISQMRQAESKLRGAGNTTIAERLKGYVRGHIESAASDDNDFIGRSMATLAGIIEEVQDAEFEEVEESN